MSKLMSCASARTLMRDREPAHASAKAMRFIRSADLTTWLCLIRSSLVGGSTRKRVELCSCGRARVALHRQQSFTAARGPAKFPCKISYLDRRVLVMISMQEHTCQRKSVGVKTPVAHAVRE